MEIKARVSSISLKNKETGLSLAAGEGVGDSGTAKREAGGRDEKGHSKPE